MSEGMNPTAQEFFEEFLAEKAALEAAYHQTSLPMQAKFFSAGYIERTEAWRAAKDIEKFERSEVHGPVAKMYTVHRVGTIQMRQRYQLRLVGEKWEIHAQACICIPCQGTGQHDEKECNFCHGEGWNQLFKDRS
ncbi:MAG TPA: hypothetical protein VGH19_22260 [Verrucomicrobiae bacterium]